MNNITITGFIGQDAKSKQVEENYVLTFSIADDVFSKGAKSTQWIRCDLWRKDENLLQYLKKGTHITIYGTLRINDYEKDGVKKQLTSVIVKDFALSPRQHTDQAPSETTPTVNNIPTTELPF